MADDAGMSLERAGAALRAELNAHREKLALAAAVETALTAKMELGKIQRQHEALLVCIEAAQRGKVDAETELAALRRELERVRGQIDVSQADLTALNAGIADTRRAWAAEETARDTAQRRALADLDREIVTAQQRLSQLKNDLAAVAAPYVQGGLSPLPSGGSSKVHDDG